MDNNEEFTDDINLLDYINVLIKHKVLIIVIVFISVIAAGVISFILPKIYQATAVLIPVNQPTDRGGMSSIAAQFGISSPQTSNIAELKSLLTSNVLMEKTIKKNNLLPVLLSEKKGEEKSGSDRTWSGIRALKGILKVNHNLREGIIQISSEFTDPKVASDLINHTLKELTEYMSSEARRVAETNQKYLETLINKNPDPLIRQKIYALIAQQIETSMMAEVKENFAFKVLDPPKVPDMKIRPSIRKNVVLAFVLSLFGAIFIVFLIEYVKSAKARKRESAEARERESS